MPRTYEEERMSSRYSADRRREMNDKIYKLRVEGIDITPEVWEMAKRKILRLKLKGLEEEYKFYFKENNYEEQTEDNRGTEITGRMVRRSPEYEPIKTAIFFKEDK
jgi:hypothetical protein